MNQEHEDQRLDAAYRQASRGEAGRPGAGTRAAILAEAAAAARRRTPAANESRYLLRAVAGIAVLGVALLLWRQTDHRLPGEAPSLDVPVTQQAMRQEADSAFVPDEPTPPPQAPGELPPSSAQSSVAPANAQKNAPPAPQPPPAESAAVAGNSIAVQPENRAVPPPPPPPPPSPSPQLTQRAPDLVDENAQLEEVQVTGSRVLRERRMVGPRGTVPAPAGGAAPAAAQDALRDEPSAEELLQDYFPAQYQSGTPRRVWLVRDAEGSVWSTGELGPREQLADQLASIRRSLDARDIEVQSVQSVPNGRAVQVELTILQVR